nr:Na+/H+ antiporter NhaC family protein [Parvularcula dongshanensis]
MIPPLAAIAFAIVLRNVYGALLLALFLSEAFVAGGPVGGLTASFDRVVEVFGSAYNTQILLFCLLIGAVIALARDSGGVAATARALLGRGIVRTPRRAELMVAATGTALFVETNVSLLGSGVLGRPLYDAHGLSRERLAYIIDSTSAPVSVLVPFNGWGAYAMGLVAAQGLAQPFGVVLGAVPLNFYALLTVGLVYVTALTGRVFGPMRAADARTEAVAAPGGAAPTRPRYMWVPLGVLVGGALLFMTLTGGGSIVNGDGARSILWAVSLAALLGALLVRRDRVMDGQAVGRAVFGGIGEMVPLVTVLLLALALGASLNALGTGEMVARLAAGSLPPFLAPAVLFVAAGVASFSTGTSWGTYGLLIPIAMPLAAALGVPPTLALAAVLGGGVFGDHCSPLSDTTLIASVASGTEHLSHVTTQLPYALATGAAALAAYLISGLVVSL